MEFTQCLRVVRGRLTRHLLDNDEIKQLCDMEVHEKHIRFVGKFMSPKKDGYYIIVRYHNRPCEYKGCCYYGSTNRSFDRMRKHLTSSLSHLRVRETIIVKFSGESMTLPININPSDMLLNRLKYYHSHSVAAWIKESNYDEYAPSVLT